MTGRLKRGVDDSSHTGKQRRPCVLTIHTIHVHVASNKESATPHKRAHITAVAFTGIVKRAKCAGRIKRGVDDSSYIPRIDMIVSVGIAKLTNHLLAPSISWCSNSWFKYALLLLK